MCRYFFYILILLLFHFTGFSQKNSTLFGYVLTADKQAIVGVSVYVRGFSTTGTTTNEDGFFSLKIPKDSSALALSCVGYEDTELELVGLSSPIQITLHENNILLHEVIIKPNIITIESILACIRQSFKKNNYQYSPIFKANGIHLATEGVDTLVYLASPFTLKINSYPRNNGDLSNIQLQTQNNTTLHKGKTNRIIPYYLEVFMAKWFKWASLDKLPFIHNPKSYSYDIADYDDYYTIFFKPKTQHSFQYYGNFKVLKADCSITEIHAKLIFNDKNSEAVISTQKKYPSVWYYYENQEINLYFSQNFTNKLWHLQKIEGTSILSRVIEKNQDRLLYRINTNLSLQETNVEFKGKELLEMLFIDAEKAKK